MRELLEQLLRAADLPTQERAQLLWDEYRTGAPNASPAFATLLAWYGGALYRRIWGLVRSDAAEDVFQNVLKKLHENRRKAGLANFHREVLPWLRTVADNECASHHRRIARRRRGESHAAHPETDADAESRRELQMDLAESLALLKPDQRAAIALHFFEGKDKQDAAAELGIDRGTFASRLNAGLNRLQQLLPAKAVLALGAVGVPTSLSAVPPPLSATRLGELVAAAWAKAGAPGWSFGQVAAVLGGFALCGSIAAGEWALTREPPRTEGAAPVAPLVATPRESLQEQNRRILENKVIPLVLGELQALATPDNPVRVEGGSIQAYGSWVVVTFERTRPVPNDSMSKVRLHYCTLTRHFWGAVYDARGSGQWRDVPVEQPLTIRVPLPSGGVLPVRTFGEPAKRIRAAFELLPRDERAEEEQIRYYFGPGGWTGEDFTVPTGCRGVAGNTRELFVCTEHWLTFVRRATGGWRYWSRCEGRRLAADDTHLYYVVAEAVWSVPIARPTGDPKKVCDTPAKLPVRSLAAGAGRLFVATDQREVLHERALTSASVEWPKSKLPPYRRIATDGRSLFVQGEGRFYQRPLDPPEAEWVVHEMPPNAMHLAVWGDQLLAIPKYAGPIHTRPLAGSPDASWKEIGRVHDPSVLKP